MNIIGHSGIHRPNRNDSNVQELWIRDSNMRFIPQNIGRLINLKALFFMTTRLVEIKAQDFVGTEELEYISFLGNLITSLPRNVFAKLGKLKLIDLASSQIEVVPRGLFNNNLDLEVVRFQTNRIRFIESGMFNGLMKLNVVNTLSDVSRH